MYTCVLLPYNSTQYPEFPQPKQSFIYVQGNPGAKLAWEQDYLFIK